MFGIDGLCGGVWKSKFYKNCSNLSIDMQNISFVKTIRAVIGSLSPAKLIFLIDLSLLSMILRHAWAKPTLKGGRDLLSILFVLALRVTRGDLSGRMTGYFCERSELLVSFFTKWFYYTKNI